jgi:hypothetical protein
VTDDYTFYLVEQFVDLGNESFWHEKGRLFQWSGIGSIEMMEKAHMIGKRDVVKYGSRYRIRVVKEETVFDSEDARSREVGTACQCEDSYGCTHRCWHCKAAREGGCESWCHIRPFEETE